MVWQPQARREPQSAALLSVWVGGVGVKLPSGLKPLFHLSKSDGMAEAMPLQSRKHVFAPLRITYFSLLFAQNFERLLAEDAEAGGPAGSYSESRGNGERKEREPGLEVIVDLEHEVDEQ